jgi:hypothetical protein
MERRTATYENAPIFSLRIRDVARVVSLPIADDIGITTETSSLAKIKIETSTEMPAQSEFISIKIIDLDFTMPRVALPSSGERIYVYISTAVHIRTIKRFAKKRYEFSSVTPLETV